MFCFGNTVITYSSETLYSQIIIFMFHSHADTPTYLTLYFWSEHVKYMFIRSLEISFVAVIYIASWFLTSPFCIFGRNEKKKIHKIFMYRTGTSTSHTHTQWTVKMFDKGGKKRLEFNYNTNKTWHKRHFFMVFVI